MSTRPWPVVAKPSGRRTFQCTHEYAGGGRCVFMGCKIENDLCSAHKQEKGERQYQEARREANRIAYASSGMPIRRPKKKGSAGRQPSRVQSARTIIDKLPPAHIVGDPTAPWCTCHHPCDCDKPTWDTWRAQVAAR